MGCCEHCNESSGSIEDIEYATSLATIRLTSPALLRGVGCYM
jgi:hypothetical protein